MNLTERISYIKGLAEGLALDSSKPEIKIINAIIEFLDDMAYDLTDLEELYDELSEQVDEIDEDLATIESDVYDDDCDCDCDCEDCCDDFDEDEENPFYEVTCSACGQKLNVSEDVLLEGEIECPNCGEVMEFDFSNLFDDDECDCCSSCEDCKEEISDKD